MLIFLQAIVLRSSCTKIHFLLNVYFLVYIVACRFWSLFKIHLEQGQRGFAQLIITSQTPAKEFPLQSSVDSQRILTGPKWGNKKYYFQKNQVSKHFFSLISFPFYLWTFSSRQYLDSC